MNAKNALTTVTLSLALAGALVPTSVSAGGPPIHAVYGHAVFNRNVPPGFIDQISINVTQDANGVHGEIIWASNYGIPAVDTGWVGVIDMHTLIVDGNSAIVGGTIILDNRFPENEGVDQFLLIIDNGNGAADPADEVGVPVPNSGDPFDIFPVVGGDLTVE